MPATPALSAAQIQSYIDRCEHALDAALERARQAGAWDARWSRPQLRFSQRGRAAGTAHAGLWQIRLNPRLLVSAPEFFLHEVIPHELAHLMVFARHGRKAPHGVEWKSLMSGVFGLAPKVTHSLDLAVLPVQQFAYRCGCQLHQLTLRRHNKVLRGQQRYLCRQCGQTLQRAAEQDAAAR